MKHLQIKLFALTLLAAACGGEPVIIHKLDPAPEVAAQVDPMQRDKRIHCELLAGWSRMAPPSEEAEMAVMRAVAAKHGMTFADMEQIVIRVNAHVGSGGSFGCD